MNKEKFGIGDLVTLKGNEETIGFIVEVSLNESNTHRYRIHWFQIQSPLYWYNENVLIPK